MKRMLCPALAVLLALLLTVQPAVPALAAQPVDLSGMTYEELLTLRDQVDQAIREIETARKNAPLIQDDAGLLSDWDKAILQEIMLRITPYGKPMFRTTADPAVTSEKVDEYFDQILGSESGILLHINIYIGELNFLMNGDMKNHLTEETLSRIILHVQPLANKWLFASCAQQAFSEVEQELNGEAEPQMGIKRNIGFYDGKR